MNEERKRIFILWEEFRKNNFQDQKFGKKTLSGWEKLKKK